MRPQPRSKRSAPNQRLSSGRASERPPIAGLSADELGSIIYVALFPNALISFLCEMLALSLSRKTLRQHRDNIWVLGGEVIRRVQMDSGLRRRPVKQVVLDLIGDDG